MTEKRYYPLDAARFVLFLYVFFCHLPLTFFPFVEFLRPGKTFTPVHFFFIISGFVITLIILQEKRLNRQFNLKHFFLLRILRTWPLYYAMVLFAFLTPVLLRMFQLSGSDVGYQPEWWTSVFFLENYKMMFTGQSPAVAPLPVMWSLCVEEHFYLVWGLSLFFCKERHIPALILIAFVVGNASRVLYSYYNIAFIDLFSTLDFFAFGAIPAYLCVARESWSRAIVGKIPAGVKITVLCSLMVCVFLMPHINFPYEYIVEPVIICSLSALLILFVVYTESSRLNTPGLLSALGKYTYSLYMIHTIVINGSMLLLTKFMKGSVDSTAASILFFVFTLSLSMLISYGTFHLLEQPFRRLRKFFE